MHDESKNIKKIQGVPQHARASLRARGRALGVRGAHYGRLKRAPHFGLAEKLSWPDVGAHTESAPMLKDKKLFRKKTKLEFRKPSLSLVSKQALSSSTEPSMKRTIPIGFLETPCIDEYASLDLFDIDSDNTWMTPIICYIQNGDLPTDKQQARKLRIQSLDILSSGTSSTSAPSLDPTCTTSDSKKVTTSSRRSTKATAIITPPREHYSISIEARILLAHHEGRCGSIHQAM
ncbi:hypothetical protein TIFTF001_027539 [Ficus carica]|uniref:Uncharacterized protein n=1 Tax=Ficus carica TaxID=3494 RepID=A0AA88DN76_FICCA|nr:hypothetical protein TIFTF001_027539 [Ficus carica]